MTETIQGINNDAARRPSYVPPVVTSYTSDEILEQVGPAMTLSGPPQ